MKYQIKLALTIFVVGLAGTILFQALTHGWSTTSRALVATAFFFGLLAVLVGLAIHYSMRDRARALTKNEVSPWRSTDL
ncbi:hypothetical protein K7640_28240 [Micromonospora sp. PLK6-60]|uniref:hypothetical protein n=1 Tax=Micromonospora sp. PLK6-60 TaxID=2873383 RepID=UPI001CA6B907|nr:hypothetical protein [Micromonospora sp. PLK6-60]MBY8875725.1 hypothetical protein [Micromonospora sp. PLK6-60]